MGEKVAGEVEILPELDSNATLFLMLSHFLLPDLSPLLASCGLYPS